MKCDYKYCIYYDNEKCTHNDVELRNGNCTTCRVIFLQNHYLLPKKTTQKTQKTPKTPKTATAIPLNTK
ncbi:MAG: hypothetical protein FWC89_08585 [Defluviitaleaceae bacterium]|nr:hypothetical protein [Defluviitaleaceae bacterium]